MDMDFSINLIYHALDKNFENDLWKLWEMQYGYLVKKPKEEFITFDNYKDNLLTKKYTEKTYEEIENEMLKVERAFEKRR